MLLNEKIAPYISIIQAQYDAISPDRKAVIQALADYIKSKRNDKNGIHLLFICTHNSRRSQLAQIWAQIAAYYYNIPSVISYSGGTEVTAFHPNAIAAIARTGIQVAIQENGRNPIYTLSYAKHADPIIVFSKIYDEQKPFPKEFAAVMTCAHADQHCPMIPGVAARIPLRYEDPKTYDGTPLEAEKYDASCLEIASELFYTFSLIKTDHD